MADYLPVFRRMSSAVDLAGRKWSHIALHQSGPNFGYISHLTKIVYYAFERHLT